MASAAMVVFWSCSSDGDAPGPAPAEAAGDAIAFGTGVAQQKAKGRASTTLETIYTSFGVKAFKTIGGEKHLELGFDTEGDSGFVVEYLTRGGEQGWYYDGIGTQVLHYWDFNASEYLFSAYAPIADPAEHTVGWSADGYVSISDIEANSTSATGWLIARMRRDASGTDIVDTDMLTSEEQKTPAVLNETVDLVFHRLLANVEFRIYSGNGDPFTVTAMKGEGTSGATFTTKADYVGAAAWDSPSRWAAKATTTELFDVEMEEFVEGTDREHATSLCHFFEIPQALEADTELTLTLTIDGEEVELEIPATYVSWKANDTIVYYIKYSPDQQIILVDVVTSPWKHGDDIDEEQHNW